MKKLIVGVEKDWLAILFGIIGVLLTLFPEQLTKSVPFLLGAALLLRGLVSLFIFWQYREEQIQPGKALLYLVLGAAVFHHSADALGPIGSIWAMVSLNEVAEEVNEAAEKHRFSPFHAVMSLISVSLAILLLFDPFEHFSTHIRVLGLEMIVSVLVRRHDLLHK